MPENTVNLSTAKQEQLKQRAESARRKRLEESKPQLSDYKIALSLGGRFIVGMTENLPLLIAGTAFMAMSASSVRTMQTAYEIYIASDSPSVIAFLVAISFTIAAEGALFLLAVAQKQSRVNKTQEGQYKWTLRKLLASILMRFGLTEPQLKSNEESSFALNLLVLMTFAFTVTSNAFIGLRPIVREIGEVSLQVFFVNVWSASAHLQLQLIVDVVATLFPPLMSLVAGHLVAGYMLDFIGRAKSFESQFEGDLNQWRNEYSNPLSSEAGQALYESFVNDEISRVASKRVPKPKGDAVDTDLPLAISQP